MDTNLKNEITFLLKPVLISISIIILIFVVISIGFNKIKVLKNTIETNKNTAKVLTEKKVILETVDEILSGDVTFLDIVLPSKGAVLYGLSQIKSQALVYNLQISNLKTGNVVPVSDGVQKTSMGFEVTGEAQNVYDFLESFSKILPLVNIDKVSVAQIAGLTSATVSLNIYSAELPKKIPALTTSVAELSREDLEVLQTLAEFTPPQFLEPAIVNITEQKTDPFN